MPALSRPCEGEAETLYDWVEAFITAGETLDTLLAKGPKTSTADARDAVRMRAHLIGLLGRFRAVLGDEIAESDELKPALLDQVFARFDKLEAKRQKSAG